MIQESRDEYEAVIEAIDALETEPDRHVSIQRDAAIRRAIIAAKASGKPATVTVAIKVTPGADRRVQFTATLTEKLPKPPTNTVTMYADDTGGIFKSDPAQLKLPITPPRLKAAKEE